MFTGLVATKSLLATRLPRGPGARLIFRATFEDGPLVTGESIGVDGVCSSVDVISTDGFEADTSADTLARTPLRTLEPGDVVRLERAVSASDRLGGHAVTGHVHTLAKTKLGALAPAQPVNLEVDVVARYVSRLVATGLVG